MKKFAVLLILCLTFIVRSETTKASILVVNKEGEVVWNVLSDSDSLALGAAERGELTVREVAGENAAHGLISLKKESNKVVLNYGSKETLDVTNWGSDLVEIEERGKVKKIKIFIRDGRFVIEQAGIQAVTDLPININPKENELSLTTSAGAVFLSVLPLEAAETTLRSRLVSKVDSATLEIKEKDLGVLAYTVKGEKIINILNIIKFNIPVTSFVSTSTGELLAVEQPFWLKLFGFLFA